MTTGTPDSNSYIFDPESSAELARLINYDRIITRAMGGTLPEQPIEVLDNMHHILDMACGPGGWVLDVAFAYPHIEVAGVDISQVMISYAHARAHSQGIKNASFGVMDITQPLDFSDASFDLVNARSIFGVLPRTVWSSFITECTRILRPGGILRLTEVIGGFSTSSAFEQWNAWLLQALHQIGYGFSPRGYSINVTTVLPWMLRQAGYSAVHTYTTTLECSADTSTWADGYRSLEIAMHMSEPLLIGLGLATSEELQHLINQFQIDAHSENFCSMQHNLTVWGTK